jgi:hypothetical protein
MRVGLEVHREAEKGQESGGNNRRCDYGVNCSEHDTHPFVPRPSEGCYSNVLVGRRFNVCSNYSGWARLSLMGITLCGFMRAVAIRFNALSYL